MAFQPKHRHFILRLQPSDCSAPVEVPYGVATQMRIIKNMIEDIGILEEVIPIPNVRGDIFEIVLEYCEKYRENEDCEQSIPRDLEINDWDQQFLRRHSSKFYAIIVAANYLEVVGLLDLGIRYIVKNMCDKTPRQIREFFNIPNDWDPTLYKTIMKENGWNEDD